MAQPVRIAVDAMGGDVGASVVIPGVARFLESTPDVRFLIFGDRAVIEKALESEPRLRAVCEVVHAEVSVGMNDKPSVALRRGRRVSSMWMAIEAVKKGDADMAISAGNTGALMAMSKVCLKTLGGVDRPAIAGLWPTLKGRSIVLDIGASIGADASHYVDMAIMGAAMASVVLGRDRPTVGLLNVGVEEIKGVDEVREAGSLLRELDNAKFDYHGFVEGDDIGKGVVDVVVTEGFTGNIALKTAEGTARQLATIIREAMSASLMAKIGYWFARAAFRDIREKMDPRRVNGGVFLGLEGIVVKSHGGTDALGFSGALGIGYLMVRNNVLDRIREATRRAREACAPGQPAVAGSAAGQLN